MNGALVQKAVLINMRDLVTNQEKDPAGQPSMVVLIVATMVT